uniref:Uncharacterized protein n=1 Tax=viral metagenome TaxID=1070528 RepID=A0A6M3JSZ3_9ZZZZ
MKRITHKIIKELIDLCWEIRRANVEGGDIAAGQYLHREFEEKLDRATAALSSETLSE